MKDFRFSIFSNFPEVTHQICSRRSGVSQAPFDSLNLSDLVGDNPECVGQNRLKVQKTLNASAMVWARLEHGSKIACVTAENAHQTFVCDALFTQEKSVALAVTFADCQAAIFYDPIQQALAVVHAGWKGLVQKIYEKAVHFMEKKAKSRPQDIRVAIGPSLGPCHAQMLHYKRELPKEMWPFMVKPWHFDFWAIAKKQLLSLGILPSHLEVSNQCTVCHSDSFFSFRQSRITGRSGIAAMIQDKSLKEGV